MQPLFTPAQVREMDRRAIAGGVPAAALMERAAGHLARGIVRAGGRAAGLRVALLCGRGNNGGDGFVVARLAHEHGYQTDCLVAAAESELRAEASVQLRAASARGVQAVFADDERWHRKLECMAHRDLLVDALLGTGSRHEVRGAVQEAIQAINRSGVPALAVDIPSGIHPDTGEELGESVWALRTVTFGHPKPYLFQGIGLEHSGFWTVADIGYPQTLLTEPTDARLLDQNWVGSLLPERLRGSHKGENGSILIVAGSRAMRGAATLAALSSLRSGAGLVTVAGIPEVCDAVAAQLPEVLLFPLPEIDGVVSPDAAPLILDKRDRYKSAVFGPGLTHERPVMEFLAAVLEKWQKPAVLDADALNAIAYDGVRLPECECVLTPHPGEMSRLLHSSIAEIQADRFHTVRQAMAELGHCVLLKGPYSIVGEPGQPMMVNHTGNPGLASGGMGDVLSGVIATLLAQDLPGYYAASCGMFWHGTAADLCAHDIGPIGYTARDVAEALPSARVHITTTCDSGRAEGA